LADFPFPILITGETGTGKYELALFMHERSRRAEHVLVDVHCANLSVSLFESELFGHERGAFTDAREQRRGKVEVAGAGTLLFDEVDCLDLITQAKLLRFFDRRTYERVGGRGAMQSEAALVCTANQDLWQLTKDGLFRADLLARITWGVLRIPPLRVRTDDITLLAGMFLEEARLRFEIPQLRWDPAALHLLKAYPWPGNVRELKSVTYMLAYMHHGATISPSETAAVLAGRVAVEQSTAGGLVAARTVFERDYIADALKRTEGNRMHAAKLLRIGRRTLQGKIAKYRL
jgi:DNA-binding NtrC family response regulator